jgi:hypothetical protein
MFKDANFATNVYTNNPYKFINFDGLSLCSDLDNNNNNNS